MGKKEINKFKGRDCRSEIGHVHTHTDTQRNIFHEEDTFNVSYKVEEEEEEPKRNISPCGKDKFQ